MGIFTDGDGTSVAFSGSANETHGGLIENYEAIDVFWSWEDPQGRVAEKIRRFDKIWSGHAPGLEVIRFTEVTTSLLQKYRRIRPPMIEIEEQVDPSPGLESNESAGFHIPCEIELRDYQNELVENWIRNNGHGTFRLATGTGKTITALAAAAVLHEKFALQALIIVCPYTHLVMQWSQECTRFGVKPICALGSRHSWEGALSSALFRARSDASRDAFVVIVVTNATFIGDPFQRAIKHVPPKTMLIADEAHNLGAKKTRKTLPEHIKLRLALSATPERWYDDEGTAALFEYFGSVIEPELTLADALKRGILTPYKYFPLIVELNDEERNEYLDLSDQIAKALQFHDDDEEDTRLERLLIRRARLVASIQSKLDALRNAMITHIDDTHMLFYCGDGTVEAQVDETELRQVDAVCKLLGYELGVKVATYTAETPLHERGRMRHELQTGQLQGLVAIRCLDEGVDIPAIRTAFILASSTNPRQFIQRRGRILRKSKNKEYSIIYDMIVAPPDGCQTFESERNLLRKELTRVAEFADLAINSGEARNTVFELQKRYDLMDI